MSIRICIAVDTPEEALDVFSALKTHKPKMASPQVMIDPQKTTDGARVFDPSYPPETQPTPPAKAAVVEEQAPFKNTSPGWVACQKIGAETKAAILAHIGDGVVAANADFIAKKIKRTPDQTKALLQLLWDRGVILYDRKTNSFKKA
jgi:hypothetical protein